MQDNFKINAEICDSNRAGSAVRDGGIEPKIVAGCGIEKTFVGPSYRWHRVDETQTNYQTRPNALLHKH